MKKITICTLFILSIGLLLFNSCKKDFKVAEKPVNSNVKLDLPTPPFYGTNPTPLVLGAHLQNPYTLANMSQAVQVLKNNNQNPVGGSVEVRVTHHYVKFSPGTMQELLELMKDEELVLFDHPLDYEVLEQGNWYRDSNVPDGSPTYQ